MCLTHICTQNGFQANPPLLCANIRKRSFCRMWWLTRPWSELPWLQLTQEHRTCLCCDVRQGSGLCCVCLPAPARSSDSGCLLTPSLRLWSLVRSGGWDVCGFKLLTMKFCGGRAQVQIKSTTHQTVFIRVINVINTFWLWKHDKYVTTLQD